MSKKTRFSDALLILAGGLAVYAFANAASDGLTLNDTKPKMNTQSNNEAQGVGMGPIAGFSGVY